ncbi:katanin p60 ATPase-containing subunit A-like 2 isoform X2 [Corticium candelabrum]|uniref:katanin p60 ATPase-containing subunit A-like 2 isoform X2 n=1 Tax=Corticium candelabrum TaxID=121492 RepID=UPI002E26448B|nr:katanin p60 ATPase-containing subunit A-like 2 isoform X2 [Corticium candelabrum]
MNVDLSYSKIKTANEARVSEGLREEQRKKNVLILILQHLHEEGYLETGSSLEEESGISLKKYQACDNIDLLTILQAANVSWMHGSCGEEVDTHNQSHTAGSCW